MIVFDDADLDLAAAGAPLIHAVIALTKKVLPLPDWRRCTLCPGFARKSDASCLLAYSRSEAAGLFPSHC